MTRDEAIQAIASMDQQLNQEFCVGLAEHEASTEETKKILRALGVTEDEMAAQF
jgi:hypothetical protein